MPPLDLPDVRQAQTWDCGVACAAAVLRFFGHPVGRPDAYGALTAALGANALDGTDPRALESVLRARGLRVLAGEMDLADLRRQTGAGRPVVCAVKAHWVVAAGVWRCRVHFLDPKDGPRKMPAAEFLAWWLDSDRNGSPLRQFGLSVWR